MKIELEIEQSEVGGMAMMLVGCLVTYKRMGLTDSVVAVRKMINAFYKHMSKADKKDMYEAIESANEILDDKELLKEWLDRL